MARYRTRGAQLKITEALIDDAARVLAEHGLPDELVVRDTELKGFVVRLRVSGRHTYGAAYRRGKLLTLGTSDRLTAGKARKAAREALAQTSLEGAPVPTGARGQPGVCAPLMASARALEDRACSDSPSAT